MAMHFPHSGRGWVAVRIVAPLPLEVPKTPWFNNHRPSPSIKHPLSPFLCLGDSEENPIFATASSVITYSKDSNYIFSLNILETDTKITSKVDRS